MSFIEQTRRLKIEAVPLQSTVLACQGRASRTKHRLLNYNCNLLTFYTIVYYFVLFLFQKVIKAHSIPRRKISTSLSHKSLFSPNNSKVITKIVRV